MTTNRFLAPTIAVVLALATGCAGSNEPAGSPTTDTTVEEPDESDDIATVTSSAVPTSSAAPTTAAGADVDVGEWAERLISAFVALDDERNRLESEVNDELSELPPDASELDFFAVIAIGPRGLADAGDVLLADLPTAHPPDLAETARTTIDALATLTEQRRRAADGLETGDPTAYNELQDVTTQFSLACSDLQFVVFDLGHGFLPCGIVGEAPEVPPFIEGPTTDETDVARAEDVPPGTWVIEYLGLAVPEAPDFELVVDTTVDLEIATSIAIAALRDPDSGASLRVHVEGLVADVTQLQPDSIPNFWPIPDGPAGWIGALEGVRTDATGTGRIAGIDGEYWELTSERDGPIALLGDGPDGIAETTLDPAETVRLWWLQVGGWPVLITEHAPKGVTLADVEDDLSVLRDAVTIATP